MVTLSRENELPTEIPLGDKKTIDPLFVSETGELRVVIPLRTEAKMVPLVMDPSNVTEDIPLSVSAVKKSKRWKVLLPAVTPPVMIQLPLRHEPPI